MRVYTSKEICLKLPIGGRGAVIVRTCKELKRDNGMIIRYDDNAAVVIDQEGNPKETRVFGAIARELRQFNFTTIVSLAPEIEFRFFSGYNAIWISRIGVIQMGLLMLRAS
ncbi:hypothetical protein R6Q57_009131 [Mikania cordata]